MQKKVRDAYMQQAIKLFNESDDADMELLALWAIGRLLDIEHKATLRELIEGPTVLGNLTGPQWAANDLVGWGLAVGVVVNKDMGTVAATVLGLQVYKHLPDDLIFEQEDD